MTEVSWWRLNEASEKAVRFVEAPHVDLATILGSPVPIRVGLDDVAALLKSGEPSFQLSLGDTSISVHRQDGGAMGSIAIRF